MTMSASEAQLRAEIVEVGRRSVRARLHGVERRQHQRPARRGRLLMTPTSVCKGFMTPDMMCITDLDGRKLAGERDPSSEMQMHLEVYRQRPDVQAVVHAHPPTATGFAVAGIPLDRAVLAEVVDDAREHPDCRVRDAVDRRSCPKPSASYVKAHDGMLLANHGALTLGQDLFAAYYKMETIEHFAKISLVARLLGGERLLIEAGGGTPPGAARPLRHHGAGANLPRAVDGGSGGMPGSRGSSRAGRQLVGAERLAWPRSREPRAADAQWDRTRKFD